jgi:hypothetical protein
MKAEYYDHHRDIDSGKESKAPLHEGLPCQGLQYKTDHDEQYYGETG